MPHKPEIIGAIIFALLVLGTIIDHWRVKRRLSGKPHEPSRSWFFALATGALFFFVALSVPYVHAHDHEHPELQDWYEHLRGNGPCCDGSDAKHVADVDWETKDGHYRVRMEGKWVDVPDAAVVQGPNRDGRTLVWPYWINGEPQIRCFMPGTMT